MLFHQSTDAFILFYCVFILSILDCVPSFRSCETTEKLKVEKVAN